MAKLSIIGAMQQAQSESGPAKPYPAPKFVVYDEEQQMKDSMTPKSFLAMCENEGTFVTANTTYMGVNQKDIQLSDGVITVRQGGLERKYEVTSNMVEVFRKVAYQISEDRSWTIKLDENDDRYNIHTEARKKELQREKNKKSKMSLEEIATSS
jgi:uncharacterized FlgJ-related protein